MPVQPKTEYARSGDVSIAYQVLGEAALDLVWIPSLTHHVELNWENPVVAQFLRRLASVARVLVFDKRGTGMSDRLAGTETLEERMDDIRAVMDAAGSERAVISGLGDGGPLAMLFAATYPERTQALILGAATSPTRPGRPGRLGRPGRDASARVSEHERGGAKSLRACRSAQYESRHHGRLHAHESRR